MATLRVVSSPLAHPRSVSTATGRCNVLHSSALGSRYYALLNQRERSCHCYCWFRGISLSVLLPPTGRFLAIPLGCQHSGSEGAKPATAPFRVPMNFINKTTLAGDVRHVPTKHKLTGHAATLVCMYRSARPTSVENLYVPDFPFLSTSCRAAPRC